MLVKSLDVFSPNIFTLAEINSLLFFLIISISFISNLFFSKKARAGLSGFPLVSNEIFFGGPTTYLSISFCFFSRPFMVIMSLLGVEKEDSAEYEIECSSRLLLKLSSSCLDNSLTSRAGISSTNISSKKFDSLLFCFIYFHI